MSYRFTTPDGGAPTTIGREQMERYQEAEREQRRREEAAARLDAYRDQLRARWLSNGGTAESFGQAWPKLRDEYLIEAIADPVESIYERMRHGRVI